MYFIANWKMFGDLKILKSLNTVIKINKLRCQTKRQTAVVRQTFQIRLRNSNIISCTGVERSLSPILQLQTHRRSHEGTNYSSAVGSANGGFW